MVTDRALQARTSVACARVGMLTTYARHPSRQRTSSVTVVPRADGTVEVRLARDAVGVRQLLARPVATLEVAPVGREPVLLHGTARRLSGAAGGCLAFHLEVAAVRVGAPSVLVDERAYLAASPDPLVREAPSVLAHLNTGHADALAACLRAVGHEVGYAHATGLDAGGLTVAAVTSAGVDTVRLRFPRRVASLGELPPSLSATLDPRCGCSASRGGADQASD